MQIYPHTSCLRPAIGVPLRRMSAEAESREIARAREGDRIAMRALIDRHTPAIYALSYRMLHRCEDAEDVTQETFLRAWKALPRWQAKARFSTWLHRIALNLCYDRLRKHREPLFAEPPDQIDTQTPLPDADLQARQTQAAVEAALARLPDRQRAALTLTALQGHSDKEAAAIMKISIRALESLLARARRGLKRELAPLKETL